MSQKLVLELLIDLGGRATIGKISSLARERYPDATLHTYVGFQLRKLRKWGTVDYDQKTKEWFIIPSDAQSVVSRFAQVRERR